MNKKVDNQNGSRTCPAQARSVSNAPDPIVPLESDVGESEYELEHEPDILVDPADYRPNWDYWTKHESWTVEEAAALLHDIDPAEAKRLFEPGFPADTRQSWYDTLGLLVEAIDHGVLLHFAGNEWINGIPSWLGDYPRQRLKIAPSSLVKWAESKKIAVPTTLALTLPPDESVDAEEVGDRVDVARFPLDELRSTLNEIGAALWQGGKVRETRRDAINAVNEAATARCQKFDPLMASGTWNDLFELLRYIAPQLLRKRRPNGSSISSSDPEMISPDSLSKDAKNPRPLVAYPNRCDVSCGWSYRDIFPDAFDSPKNSTHR